MMSEIDYLKAKLHDSEKAFNKLHKRHIDLLIKQGQLEKENEQLRQQQQRLFNYFNDYLKDEIPVENFSEMWDNVKEDERWG